MRRRMQSANGFVPNRIDVVERQCCRTRYQLLNACFHEEMMPLLVQPIRAGLHWTLRHRRTIESALPQRQRQGTEAHRPLQVLQRRHWPRRSLQP